MGPLQAARGNETASSMSRAPQWLTMGGILALSGIGSVWPVGCGQPPRSLTEEFSRPLVARDGARFGTRHWLMFELYRQGTFVIDGQSGFAWQRSDRYPDTAILRSTDALPPQYKVSAVVGEIEYTLSALEGMAQDPQYAEGPQNENGCYLLVITDTAPTEHYTNEWWHQHRKVVIDVDNNVWGTGMPHPIFMGSLDNTNRLVSWSGEQNTWQRAWDKAVEYRPEAWHRVSIERTQPTSS